MEQNQILRLTAVYRTSTMSPDGPAGANRGEPVTTTDQGTAKSTMTPDEVYADIVGEFRRMGFVRHGDAEPPSGLRASVAVLEKCEASDDVELSDV